MPSTTISSLSTIYVTIEVFTEDGRDPTGDTVQAAFPIYGADPTHWGTASWVTVSGATTRYFAKILVGPGSPFGSLGKGKRKPWVKVTDSPEVPVLESPDILTVI